MPQLRPQLQHLAMAERAEATISCNRCRTSRHSIAGQADTQSTMMVNHDQPLRLNLNRLPGDCMTLSHAVLVLLLADRIHGTDAAIRKAAKNVVKKLPRSKRDIIWSIIESNSPSDYIRHIAENLDF